MFDTNMQKPQFLFKTIFSRPESYGGKHLKNRPKAQIKKKSHIFDLKIFILNPVNFVW